MSRSGSPEKVQRAHLASEVGEMDESWMGFMANLALPGTQEQGRGPRKLVGSPDKREADLHVGRPVCPLVLPPGGETPPNSAGGLWEHAGTHKEINSP